MATTKQQFNDFHDANPKIRDMFVGFTDALIDSGVTKIRADEILHRVRWQLIIEGRVDFAINKLKVLYGNRYAMELMLSERKYVDFFELKVAYDQ